MLKSTSSVNFGIFHYRYSITKCIERTESIYTQEDLQGYDETTQSF